MFEYMEFLEILGLLLLGSTIHFATLVYEHKKSMSLALFLKASVRIVGFVFVTVFMMILLKPYLDSAISQGLFLMAMMYPYFLFIHTKDYLENDDEK